MNKSSLHQESNLPTHDSELFDIKMSIIGAAIGVIFFLLLSFLLEWIIQSRLLYAALLSPGLLFVTLTMNGSLGDRISSIGYLLILYSISSIPFAVIGCLIVSKAKTKRRNGITLLVIYLIISMALAIFLLGSADS